MISNSKIGVLAVVAALLVALGAFGFGPKSVSADVTGVWWMSEYGIPLNGATATSCDDPEAPIVSEIFEGDTIVLHTGDAIVLCVDTSDPAGEVSFDSNDYGNWEDAACGDADGDGDVVEWPDDQCIDELGEGTDRLLIPATSNDVVNDVTIIEVTFECEKSFGVANVTIEQDVTADSVEFEFDIECRADADKIEITANPTTVEIAPARANTSHSLITVVATDKGGNPAFAGYVIFDDSRNIVYDGNESPEIDFTTNLCTIEESGVDTESEFEAAEALVKALSTAYPSTYVAWEFSSAASATSTSKTDTSNLFYVDGPDSGIVTDRTVAAAVLGCNPADFKAWAPGIATVTATLEVPGPDKVASVDVTVVGPPAAIVVEAAPTELICGEKATITVTVQDAIGQNVSDHTRVEIITNLGGVLGGTGAAAGFSLPTTPISSTAADTFAGVATAYLLTSNAHAGPYEILATSGGTSVDDFTTGTYLGGVFSTAPVVAQTTVNCSLPAPAPAPTITAPDTGTGVITPPDTGDAGLVSERSSSSWLLLALAGSAVAMALAGLTFKVVRR